MTDMLFLVISDNRDFASEINMLTASYFVPVPEIMLCSYNSGRENIKKYSPKIIIIDLDGNNQESMEDYLLSLVPKYSVPIIACSSKLGMKYTMMNAGAMDVITKPARRGEERFARRFTESIARTVNALETNSLRSMPAECRKVIAIGGSTGSTEALKEILKSLPRSIPPIAAVLHMPEVYTALYARQLNESTVFDVIEAKSGVYLHSGQVVIGAGGRHLRVFSDKKGYFITSEPGVKVSGHCPSVDVFFDSVAYSAKNNAVGVILTGMGTDGTKGMLSMKKMGAYNIGQNEESSVVYGMPKSAFDAGALARQCSLTGIVTELAKLSFWER